MEGSIKMRVHDNPAMAIKMFGILASLAALLGALGMLFGCALSGGVQSDKERMAEVIARVQQIESAITWITPFACSAITIAKPEAVPACQMAVASANALKVVTDQAISAYRSNSSEQNAGVISDVLGKLMDAWSNLDAAYKGDASGLEHLQHQSRIHPWKWKRRSIFAFPCSMTV